MSRKDKGAMREGDPLGSTRCKICGRLLTNPVSVEREIGPVCWARLQKRLKYGSLVEEYEGEQAAGRPTYMIHPHKEAKN